jgi:putative ABC transport system permease protein
MKYLPIVWAGLWRKPTRTILTLLSVVVAFLMFGLLHGVLAGFDQGVEKMSDTRLRIQSRINIFNGLPLAHVARIERIPGVVGVTYAHIFGGYYQEPLNPIAAASWDMQQFYPIMPEIEISKEHRAAMTRTRTGAIVGEKLAEEHGWKVGDKVTITSPVWTNADGSQNWEFEIAGLYSFKEVDFPSREFWFHYEYFDEIRSVEKGRVHLFLVGIEDPNDAARITSAIDQEFINSADPTKSQNEREYMRAQLKQVGDINFFINAILGSVLFTLLFLTGNTMMQSVRQRIPEWAVLKTYGYGDLLVTVLMFVEALVLCLVAAFMGLIIAAIAYPIVFSAIGVGGMQLPVNVFLQGAGIAVLLALISTLPPAWHARNLQVVDALAGK